MVLGVVQFNYACHISLGQTLVAMATKICDFQHKIRYNIAFATDTSRCLHILGDLISQFNAASQTLLTLPLLPC